VREHERLTDDGEGDAAGGEDACEGSMGSHAGTIGGGDRLLNTLRRAVLLTHAV
jgi:hypothetical protein